MLVGMKHQDLQCPGPVTLREIRKTAKIVKMIENRNFRMPDLKSPAIVKMMDFRIFRMPGLKCPQIVKIMYFRIFRMPDLKSKIVW